MIRGQRKARPYPPSVQASPATGKACHEADALARAAAFSSLRATPQNSTHAKHAGSRHSPTRPKGSGDLPFKRLTGREPTRSDPLRPRATSAPTAGSRAPSTPPGVERGSAAPRTPPFPPFPLPPFPFPLPALAHRARISAPLRPATRRRSPHVRTLPARNPALLDLREP